MCCLEEHVNFFFFNVCFVYPLQYSGLENSIVCIVHGVAESDTTKRLTLSLFYYKTKAKLMNIYKVYLRASFSVSLLVVSGSLRPHEL